MRPDPTILAFDTSGPHCAASLLRNDAIKQETHVEMSRGQAEALMPMLDATLLSANTNWSDLDAIAVGVGPGNFTGIRISVSCARGLALSLGIPAIGVSMFEVMAFQNDTNSCLVSLPAQKDQAYVLSYRSGIPDEDAQLISPSAPPSDLQMSLGMKVLGYQAELIGQAFDCTTEDRALENIPRRIALIAAQKLKNGSEISRPSPLYVRPADAAPPSDPPPVILP